MVSCGVDVSKYQIDNVPSSSSFFRYRISDVSLLIEVVEIEWLFRSVLLSTVVFGELPQLLKKRQKSTQSQYNFLLFHAKILSLNIFTVCGVTSFLSTSEVHPTMSPI